MDLYLRDYTKPTQKEKEALAEYDKWKTENANVFRNKDDPRYSHPDESIRVFLWHYNSMFPNNHLLFPPLGNNDYNMEADSFSELVYSGANEQEIQRYIKNNRKWFIPGSIFLDYNFGHHDTYLFPEQTLGGKYNADYLLIGSNSYGYHLVLVEFEKANTDFILTTSNTESDAVRKGMTQIRDLRTWLDDHRPSFIKDLGLSKYGIDVPTTRIHYYLVVSRRDKINDATNTLRSQVVHDNANLKIVTYDRLIDNVKQLDGRDSW